jgi:hypothetical protein
MSEWVFGYASLATDYADAGSVACELAGHRRVWGVAADNARTIPGYKVYLDRRDGSRPAVHVAFLDVIADPDASVGGIALPVDPQTLELLDARERNYDRRDVTGRVDGVEGRVWTYAGSDEGRERLRRGREAGTAVISRDYLEKVHTGFRALGEGWHAGLVESLRGDDLPVWDLERLDPAEAERRVA